MVECDGPNGVNNIMAGYTGTQLAGQSTLGQTWNEELSERVGELLAQEAKALGVCGLYAPGANIHRSAFGGRNYEYVSEDGLLTGKMVAAEIEGIQGIGVYCYLKHFVVNDQETLRCDGGLCVWTNEQALREIYLKPFEIAVKEAGATNIMSAYTRLGTTPVAESSALLTQVLRNEWGFHGCVVTDCILSAATCDVDRALRAGNDLFLTFLENTRMDASTTSTAAGHQALRRAAHDILYPIANSDAIQTAQYAPLNILQIAIIVFDAVTGGLLVLYFVRRHRKMKLWRAQEQAKKLGDGKE